MTGQYLVAEYFNTNTQYSSFVTKEEAKNFIADCHERGLKARLVTIDHGQE